MKTKPKLGQRGEWYVAIQILLFALIFFVFFDIKSHREEQCLSEKFANYTTYQARVRKLIP